MKFAQVIRKNRDNLKDMLQFDYKNRGSVRMKMTQEDKRISWKKSKFFLEAELPFTGRTTPLGGST